MTDPKGMIAAPPPLGDGEYEVRWTAITTDDGFVERGSFKFTVAVSASPSIEATDPGNTELPSATQAPSTVAPSPPASDATGDVLIPIAAMIVVIGVGLAWFLRRRGTA